MISSFVAAGLPAVLLLLDSATCFTSRLPASLGSLSKLKHGHLKQQEEQRQHARRITQHDARWHRQNWRMAAVGGADRPLKIAIAGGGVGGLATAYYMLKSGFDVTVYEKTAQFSRFGGPIQFASNALSTLKAMDEDLFERVVGNFTFTGTRACGIKDGLRATNNYALENDFFGTISYLWDSSQPADWYVRFPLKECADLYGLPYTGVIDRPDLQETFLEECKKLKPDFIQNGAAVESYVEAPNGQITVSLSDGTTPQSNYDMLVGSDGIWSSVRAKMYGEKVKETTSDKKKRQGCTYSGYTVFAGETVFESPDYYDTGYKVYIGPQRYFVTSDVGNGRVQWYAFFALPPGTKRAPSGWGGSSRDEQADPEEDLVAYIKSLHEGWSEEVHKVLDATRKESVEQRDLYDRSPELLRSWAKGNTVLIGDAVHPMMPNLGQGGCQALEDAYVLTEKLKQVSDTDDIAATLQDFYRSRIVRTTIVSALSRLASDLIINAFDTPWSPHDSKGTNWKSYLTFAWKPILTYVIFPLQFAYLYSFSPTGSMGDLPEQLRKKWQTRHREDSEAAFEKVRREGRESLATAPSFFAKAEESAPPATAVPDV